MTDEKYVFISDIKEKRSIGRSSYNRKTHAGKGGRVRLPSDYMTKKERDAMNGEVQSYKINKPMTWVEYKAMPDDVKVMYITAIQNRYGAPATKIAEMLGVPQQTFAREMKRIGLAKGKNAKRGKFDKENWYRWCNGAPEEIPTEETPVEEIEEAEEAEVVQEPVCNEGDTESDAAAEDVVIVPVCGKMTFRGNAANALRTVMHLLGNAESVITVAWKSCAGDELLERMVDDGK